MESPCIKVCVIDEASALCAGCYRSLDEIARWSALSDQERRRIMAELPRRAAQLSHPSQKNGAAPWAS